MSETSAAFAPGWPGIAARWTSAAKGGIGTAVSRESEVWFTLSHGVLNEIYYPEVDTACTRDLEFIVTADNYFSEEKRDTDTDTSQVAPGIPSYRIRNTARDGRYRIEKEVLTDPWRDVVLQRVRFVPIKGTRSDYRLHVLLAPHLANRGANNTAWVGDYKGTPMLFAERKRHALALACSSPWGARSVGFVGVSDGWRQLRDDGRLVETFARAENGNTALTGEIDLTAVDDSFIIAVGFGPSAMEAGQHARFSLLEDFDVIDAEYVRAWEQWHERLRGGVPPQSRSRLYRASAAVLRTHESKRVEGGIIASLSIPWGASAPDDNLGGYHLVWTRDLCEIAGAFIAMGESEQVRRALWYLRVTQERDGHWPQNMWLDGTPYWHAIQMDETALPILLVDLALRNGALDKDDCLQWWPMIRRAAAFIATRGPMSDQDRWEELPGYAPFTVAAQVAALLVAAEFADTAAESTVATYLRETADAWNADIERWLYVRDTPLAREHGIDGYYVRTAGSQDAAAAPASPIVGVDALALVRFGLRAASDPCIQNTVRVIDAKLMVTTASGTAWRRYEGDRYGEHADGSAYNGDGDGIGRPWPMLTGERGHYELAAGHHAAAEQLEHAMEMLAGDSNLLPEQVWDGEDIPELELRSGKASGSARPLVWAHAEYIKLCRSLHDGEVFDRPPQTVERYLVDKVTSNRISWRFNNRIRTMPVHRQLRIEVLAPALVHWSADGWRTTQDAHTIDTTLGVHVVDLPTAVLPSGTTITFTFRWPDRDRWEGADFEVAVA